jgi:hypothetical protein
LARTSWWIRRGTNYSELASYELVALLSGQLCYAEWIMAISKNILPQLACGFLLGATTYLWVAMGSGNVPWAASNFALLVGMLAVLLAWSSVNHFNRYDKISILVGALFTVIAATFYYGSIFVLSFPGNNCSADLLFPFLVAPYAVAIVMIIRNPQSSRNIVFLFILTFIGVSALTQFVARISIKDLIDRVHADGGCVLIMKSNEVDPYSNWTKIETVWDIPFGFIIGHRSSRVAFISKNYSSVWQYSYLKADPSHFESKYCQ